MKLAVVATGILGAVSAQASLCQSEQELAKKIQDVFAGYKNQTTFRCDYGTRGNGPLDAWTAELAAKREIQKLCPELPWDDIMMVAENIKETDQAVQIGTGCTEYVFDVGQNAFALSAQAAVGECKDSQQINLWMCIEKAVCTKVGRQSTTCSPIYDRP